MRARTSARRASQNVEFLKGEIENIPLPDNSVDVIISNCVINLIRRQGSRAARSVSGAETRRAIRRLGHRGARRNARRIRRRIELWAGCIAGALEETEYQSKLAAAGFEKIEVEPTRIYTAADAPDLLRTMTDLEKIAQIADGKFMSAFVRRASRAPQRTS